MATKRERVLKTPQAYSLYTITYLCRVETGGVQLYTNKGVLTHAIRTTRLIERDCAVVSRSIDDARKAIEEMDDSFIRILQANIIPHNTVVHILDRSTNYVEKA